MPGITTEKRVLDFFRLICNPTIDYEPTPSGCCIHHIFPSPDPRALRVVGIPFDKNVARPWSEEGQAKLDGEQINFLRVTHECAQGFMDHQHGRQLLLSRQLKAPEGSKNLLKDFDDAMDRYRFSGSAARPELVYDAHTQEFSRLETHFIRKERNILKAVASLPFRTPLKLMKAWENGDRIERSDLSQGQQDAQKFVDFYLCGMKMVAALGTICQDNMMYEIFVKPKQIGDSISQSSVAVVIGSTI